MERDERTLHDVSTSVMDPQERAAWARVAEGCEHALRELAAHHPERETFTEMWRDCRIAAGTPITGAVS